jgi:uncharacterized protein YggU (UPF0235/DUF167 family)
MIKREAGTERQHRINCSSCSACVGYHCEAEAEAEWHLLYLHPDALTPSPHGHLSEKEEEELTVAMFCIARGDGAGSSGSSSCVVRVDMNAEQEKNAITRLEAASLCTVDVTGTISSGRADAELARFFAEEVLKLDIKLVQVKVEPDRQLAQRVEHALRLVCIQEMTVVECYKALTAARGALS